MADFIFLGTHLINLDKVVKVDMLGLEIDGKPETEFIFFTDRKGVEGSCLVGEKGKEKIISLLCNGKTKQRQKEAK